jgi:inorganic triphosphatase YgiF
MTDMREIEAKFDADLVEMSAFDDLESLGSFRVVSRRDVRQDDVYFDSADERLATSHASLRVRVTPSGGVMTFKGARQFSTSANETHIASRLEDEIALPAGEIERILADPAEIRVVRPSPGIRAFEVAGTWDLQPTARLENDRTVILLEDVDGHVIEMAVDRCVGTRLADGRKTRFAEVELEAKNATRAQMIEASKILLQGVPGLVPNHRTKLERTLR